MDEVLLLTPGSRFLPLGEVAGLVLGSSSIIPVSGKLPVALINMVQRQAISASGCVRELQSTFPVPHLLMELDRLRHTGVLTSHQLVETAFVPLADITAPDTRFLATPVDGLALAAAMPAWRAAMAAGRPWIPVITGNGYTVVGPVFNGESACCPHCLFSRMDRYFKEDAGMVTGTDTRSLADQPDAPSLSSTDTRIPPDLATAIQEALLHLCAHPDPGEYFHVGRQYQLHRYQLRRRPECPVCGDPKAFAAGMSAPVTLTGTRTQYRNEPVTATWEKWSHHINPVTGIVRQFSEIGHYAWRALMPDAAPFTFLPAYGKGYTNTAAMVSCLCEAIERWSACYRGDEPLLQATAAELHPYAVLPAAIQHFAPQQLQWPEDTPALGPVPDTAVASRWLPAWSLTYEEQRYVPAEAVLYNLPATGEGRAAVFESNGMAAGSTLPEAILQGLLELIERDAAAIWWFNGLPRPAAPAEMLAGNDWYRQQRERLHEAGWQVHLLDLTLDTGAYVIAAVGEQAGAYLAGFGCHYSMEEAMLRAFTELLQLQAIMAPVKPPEGTPLDYLRPHAGAKRFDSKVTPGTVEEMITQLVSGLQATGIETIVVNCTRPDAGLPVVKVLAPGLRAFRPRFGAGRLYEAPVSLGLAIQATPYPQLIPMWMAPSREHTAKQD